MKGLIIHVLRDARLGVDCTMNGISHQFDQLTLVGEGIPEIFDVTEDCPAVKVVRRDLRAAAGGRYTYLHLEPVDERFHAGRWLMAGGNWAYTSDSRFPANHPLSIHDRFEG